MLYAADFFVGRKSLTSSRPYYFGKDHLIRNNACILQLSKGRRSGAFILVVGPKRFGYNLNWLKMQP